MGKAGPLWNILEHVKLVKQNWLVGVCACGLSSRSDERTNLAVTYEDKDYDNPLVKGHRIQLGASPLCFPLALRPLLSPQPPS